MKYGDNWVQEVLPLELQKECEGKISEYFKWKLKSVNERYANVFLCEFSNQEELEEYWQRIVNNIAVHVQSKIENLLERSNFYIWFFVTGDVSIALKREIENDTYSSKKNVVDKNNMYSLEEKLSLIKKRIFCFSFEVKNVHKNMIERVEIQNFRLYKGNHVFDFFTEKGEPSRLVVIFAPNGMGKTSFFDAVEWNLTGEIDRFTKIRNRNISGAVLRNTEADPDEPAFVKMFTEDGVWLNRTVRRLSDVSVIDYGKGTPSSSKNHKLKPHLGVKKDWESLLLQHHKIDGFISAEKPEDWYLEWGILWDPNKEKRKEFEQNYIMLNTVQKTLRSIRDELKKTHEEYDILDKNRPFISELEKNIIFYKQLSGDERFESLDFAVISSDDYIKWSNDVEKLLDKTKLELEKNSFAHSYYLTDLNIDIKQYNEAWKQKNQYEIEKQTASQKRNEIEEKICTKARYMGLEDIIKNMESDLEEQQFLVTQGPEWYGKSEAYFNIQKEIEKTEETIINTKLQIQFSEEEQDKFRVELDKKRACGKDKKEYKLLQKHLKIINMLQEEVPILSENIKMKNDELTLNYKSADNLKNKIENLKELRLSNFQAAWNFYQMNGFKSIVSSEIVSEVKEDVEKLQIILTGYEKLTYQSDTVLNEIQSNEGVLEELKGILEASRKVIKDSRIRYCPVCNTEFDTPGLLLQNTYQPVSEKGTMLKIHLIDLEQQKKKQFELVENQILEYNAKMGVLIETQEGGMRILNKKIEGLNKEINSLLEKQKNNEAYLKELQRQDQEQGIYVSYSKEGIENWYSLWDFKIRTEIENLEQRQIEKLKEIEAYKNMVRVLEEDLSQKKKEWIQLYGEIAQLFVKVKEPKRYIGKATYEDVEKNVQNLSKEKKQFQSEFNICKEKMQKYINIDENEKLLWEQKRLESDRFIFAEITTMNQTIERIRINLLLNNLCLDEKQELPGVDFFKEHGEALLNSIDRSNRILECLEKMKYSREMENYFSDWKKAQETILKEEEREGILIKQVNEAEQNYQAAKNRIEQEMQKFLQQFQVSDIYEKLEPHEKFKKLVCEFGFSEDEKPCLTFKTTEDDGEAYSPEWYFSTAQLNVVGFSLFLGRTLMSKDSLLKSILIDDPVGHFDEMNIVGFADLVRNIVENTDRQLIISTHEERVFNLIRRKLPEIEYPAQYIDFRKKTV